LPRQVLGSVAEPLAERTRDGRSREGEDQGGQQGSPQLGGIEGEVPAPRT